MPVFLPESHLTWQQHLPSLTISPQHEDSASIFPAFLRGLLKLILHGGLAYDLLLFTFSMADFIHT